MPRAITTPDVVATVRLRVGERVDGWCVRPTYRLDLVAPDQPALLLVSDARGADPEPGIWMRGRMTGEIDRGGWAARPAGGEPPRPHPASYATSSAYTTTLSR